MEQVKTGGKPSESSVVTEQSGEEEAQNEIFVQVSEPSRVKTQQDLDSVVGRHRLWMEEVLNPKAGSAEGRASFHGIDLRGMSLKGMDLRCADFSEAVLEGCDLSHADLSGCIFRGASLVAADLRGARIKKADFEDADLSEAVLDPEAMEAILQVLEER